MANTELSKRIKELRLKRGMSQDQLADVSGLSLRTIQRVESGDNIPRGDTLSRLATALQVTTEEIIDLQNFEDNHANSAGKQSKNFFDDWKKPVFYYFLSICILVIGVSLGNFIVVKICFALSMVALLMLLYSTIHLFSKKRWKAGLLTFIILLISVFGFGVISLFILPHETVVKTTSSVQMKN